MESAAPPFRASTARHSLACIRCSERKVKCDRQNPCSICVKYSVECSYRQRKQYRDRRRHATKLESVDERLKRYEALLRENGVDVGDANTTFPSHAAAERALRCGTEIATGSGRESLEGIHSGQQVTVFTPQLLQGSAGTKLIDNSLWSRVAEEVGESEESQDDDWDDSPDTSVHPDGGFGYVLGAFPSRGRLSHPPAETIRQLWHIFRENVDPICKLLHVPSLQLAMEKAIARIYDIPSGFEALMFAIYSMAIFTIDDSECVQTFGESRSIALASYVAATKSALACAKFMSSTSLVVLQALFIHILSIREDEEPRAVWSLTGIAMRISDGMGMHIDGTLLGLSPFETEMRRRMWWQLHLHDFRAAELCGQAKFRYFPSLDETTPKQPANVNDADLYPTMTKAPIESTRPTEMLWSMFRGELASFGAAQIAAMKKMRKNGFVSEELPAMDDMKAKDARIQELEDRLEAKILRFCDPIKPLHLMTMVGGRLATNITRWICHHPRRWKQLGHVPESERQLVWDVVIQLLEQYEMHQSNPQLRRFAWSVPYFIQWHVVIHALDTLRAEPLHTNAMKAWKLIDTMYHNNAHLLLRNKRPIFVAVGDLCLKAYDAREMALAAAGKSGRQPPDYILELLAIRAASEAKRKAMATRVKKSDITHTKERQTTVSHMARHTTVSGRSQAAFGQSASQPQGEIFMDSQDDAFWLDNAVFDAQNFEPMNIDIYGSLPDDFWYDTPGSQGIDWQQWDAWIGKS